MSGIETTKRVIVVGGGIAGLTVAHYLNQLGFDVRIFERDGRVGGAIRTTMHDEKYLIEHGPNTYLSSSEPLAALSRDLKLDRTELVNRSKERFVYWEGAPRALPNGPVSFLSTKLLSFTGKARMLAEPLVKSRSQEGETLADFVKRRAGSEVLDALVDPFVSGVWAGDPYELEVQSCLPSLYELERRYGSVLRGFAKAKGTLGSYGMVSYRWGMETLIARLEEILREKIRLRTRIVDIALDENGRLFVQTTDPVRRHEADAIIVAGSAPASSQLLAKIAPKTSRALNDMPSSPLAVVHTAHDVGNVHMKVRGFGMLVPRMMNVRLLGTLFSSALFEGRAPEGEVLLTSFIGGRTDRHILDLTDDEILLDVRRGLHTTMGINTKPKFFHITRLEQAIPQYTVGHAGKLHTVAQEMNGMPGVFLTGNYLTGISVSDTVGHARETADTVRQWLMRPRTPPQRAWERLI